MDYRTLGNTCYVRVDRGEEIVSALLEVCRREGIASATFSGIGGCASAELQIFNPKRGAFVSRELEGMLELVSLMGNVITDGEGRLCPHTHALFAFERDGEQRVAGGHLRAATVLYTAEIELRPVPAPGIGHRLDEETGTGFWNFG